MADFDVLKDIPGYKAILKAVLKNQIQMLVEQLSEQTGEESVILTASLSDGTLSHLGSESGKFFLEGHDEIKSQFLGFCLKRHHKRKTEETLQVPQPKRFAAAAHSPTDFSRTSPGSDIYSSSHSLSFNATSVHPVALNKTKRKQLAPNRTKSIRQNNRHGSPDVISLTPDMSSQKESGLDMTTSITELNNADYVSDSINRTDHGKSEENRMKIKTEAVDFGETAKDDTDEGIAETKRTEDSGDGSGETVNDDTVTAIKVEATEDDDELEITGVEGEITDHVTDFSQSLSDRELYLQSLPGAEGQGPSMEAKQYKATESPGTEDRPHKCPDCSKTFKVRRHLQVHYRIHSGDRPYRCSDCGQTFNQLGPLQTHRRRHTGERPYECDICKDRFMRKDSMLAHKRKHFNLQTMLDNAFPIHLH